MRTIVKIISFWIKLLFLKLLHWNGVSLLSGSSLMSRCKALTNYSVIGHSKLELGNFECASNVHIAAVAGGFLTIGDHCFINRNCTIVARNRIEIKQRCTFGPNVCIYDHDHDFGKNGQTGDFKLGEVVIGKNCWVGSGVIILRDTHIGDNCVIGAGCIVKGEIPGNSLVTADQIVKIEPLHD